MSIKYFDLYARLFVDARDGGLELSGDEILADGIIFKDKKSPKDRLEVTIGDGMEFTIHGECRRNSLHLQNT